MKRTRMTPTEAFQLAQRYSQARRLGLNPKPLKCAPCLPDDIYLPAYFLWLCFGRGVERAYFEQAIYQSKVARRGSANVNRVYQVASVRRWWQGRNSTRVAKRKNKGGDLRRA